MKLIKMLPLLLASGCTIDTGMVKDIDPQKEELKRLGEGSVLYVDTPPFLTIADKKKMMVFAEKNPKTFQTNNIDPAVRQARWTIKVLNTDNKNKCLTLEFRLLDFTYISDHPSEFFVPANSAKIAGTMLQKVWRIDGVEFVPPSSGYVSNIRVRNPVENAKRGSECDFAKEDAIEYGDNDTIFFSLF